MMILETVLVYEQVGHGTPTFALRQCISSVELGVISIRERYI